MSNVDRIRAKFALAHGRKATEHACLPLEQLVAWHEKKLNAAQSEQMQAHVAHCDHCFALWSGLVELEPAEAEVAVKPAARRFRWWQLGAPAMALGAVAVSFWIGLLGEAQLPAYSLKVSGGMQARGGDEPAVILRDDTLLQIVVMPASAVDEPVAAIGFTQSPAGLFPLNVALDVTEKGVASLTAVVGSEVLIAPDTQRLLIVVGRDGALPSGVELIEVLGERPDVTTDDWQAFSVRFGE